MKLKVGSQFRTGPLICEDVANPFFLFIMLGKQDNSEEQVKRKTFLMLLWSLSNHKVIAMIKVLALRSLRKDKTFCWQRRCAI